MSDDRAAIMDWLANSRDTGMSSKSLAYCALGIPEKWSSYPLDPSDLGRCARLIARVPSVRAAVDKLAERADQPEWKGLAPEWDRLVAMLCEESGINAEKSNRADRTYDAMKAIFNAATQDPLR